MLQSILKKTDEKFHLILVIAETFSRPTMYSDRCRTPPLENSSLQIKTSKIGLDFRSQGINGYFSRKSVK